MLKILALLFVVNSAHAQLKPYEPWRFGNVTADRVPKSLTALVAYPRISQKFCYKKTADFNEVTLRKILLAGPASIKNVGYFGHAYKYGSELQKSTKYSVTDETDSKNAKKQEFAFSREISGFTPANLFPKPSPVIGIHQRLESCSVAANGKDTKSTIRMEFTGDGTGLFYWDLTTEKDLVCWSERINTDDLLKDDGTPKNPSSNFRPLILAPKGVQATSRLAVGEFLAGHPVFLEGAARNVGEIMRNINKPEYAKLREELSKNDWPCEPRSTKTKSSDSSSSGDS